ncbi:restriction endonuclease [Streptococcus azizii]|uniref:Type-2 restriction enzyme n=1 Tax=Streptococcus azizii TaxID=1579424 RepID=A0AB36JRG1_9STRE|nr:MULTISPECIES: type II restriction endonuclease [Streptococcus]MBF0776200.1 type II restriction endonuclease [Streptococcus sp. 19428wD3_AN2]ONK28061.1 restriction endonuclease [Streptococcus azizii]ONK30459.1 restriction endonuclease [Streptococcus azizii]ONK31062.1 restriction endonuclease [Streptococcus azizii]TFU83331.1 restriction endonuclease [Streptococcus sp. AN2]
MKETRDFEEWLSTMTDTVADWTYYTDFKKVYKNVESIKIPLNIMNSLIGSANIREEFLTLLSGYPEILKVIPIIIAKRLKDLIIVKDAEKDFYFNFKKREYSDEEYADFLEKSGIFDLLQNHLISNLVDYVTGVEVGMDTNGRKNRTGHAMENIVQSYLEAEGYTIGENLFKEIYQDDVERLFSVDLSAITHEGNTSKRFDFVIKTENTLYLVEVNFYSSGGSKLNETARSYKMITEETKRIHNVEFMWFTDGKGWNSAKKNLRETFDVLPLLYNINDLKNNILKTLK